MKLRRTKTPTPTPEPDFQYTGPGGTWYAHRSSNGTWMFGARGGEMASITSDQWEACDRARDAAEQVRRCRSCEHRMEAHQPDGCWYTVVTGRPGQPMGCPCGTAGGTR